MKRRQQLEQGQALVETAIGFLFILVILLGMLDLGRLYFLYIALEDSAGEAALYLALNYNCIQETDGSECADPNNAYYRAEHAVDNNLDWTKANFTIETLDGGTGTGGRVRVTIEYPFTLVTPIISQIIGSNTLKLKSSATQTMVSE